MSILVADCPRCRAQEITFDIKDQKKIHSHHDHRYNVTQNTYEVFCLCRNCKRSTVFVLKQKNGKTEVSKLLDDMVSLKSAVNQFIDIKGYISLKDMSASLPPEYLPDDIDSAFREGAICSAVDCYNAAAAMFRLCLDLATKELLPGGEDAPNSKIIRNLGFRLPWLFEKGLLPDSLNDLSKCIKDDGNDGAHEGTLTKEDAEDVEDFTFLLLERLYTEPKRVELAAERRAARRQRGQ